MDKQRKYPLGIQTFSQLREEGYMYVDKTEYIYKMTHANTRYVFLSRPRRFGKSLLTSTLRSYFEGRKDLFKGLAIENLETEWEAYPVLHFDMSMGKRLDKDALTQTIIHQISENEERLCLPGRGDSTNVRFKNLITNAAKKYGQRVVILIDEYDSPLLDVVHEEENLPKLRDVMLNFYSPLKASDPYIRFCFFTGITKFSQLSIFSALNNIANISMEPEYAAICGISKEELLTQMSEDIDSLASHLKLSREKTIAKLIEYYDGYHFSSPSPDIFNPYSLLNAFSDGRIQPYWFDTGTPTFLVNILRKYEVTPSQIGDEEEMAVSGFDVPTERMTDATPFLYQSGYLTIKDYDEELMSYKLSIPNKEIRLGLMESLLPDYVSLPASKNSSAIIKMYKALRTGDMDGTLRQLQTYLGTIPYTNKKEKDSEGHWQQVLYIIFSLMGIYTDVEVRTPKGRVDVVMRTALALYIIELKMNQNADAAMKQIDLKDYPSRFALCGLPVVKVGINFDSEKRNISDWTIDPT